MNLTERYAVCQQEQLPCTWPCSLVASARAMKCSCSRSLSALRVILSHISVQHLSLSIRNERPGTWIRTCLKRLSSDRIAKTGRKPKAIIPVALYGMPYQIDRILEIANRYEIPVIEDAAEGLGSRFDGQVLGTFGEYGVLSFNGNKMITTSGGGAFDMLQMKTLKKRFFSMPHRLANPIPTISMSISATITACQTSAPV